LTEDASIPKEGIKVDFNGTEEAVYHKYKQRLKVNARQVYTNALPQIK
jgi:hypothetical protein